MLKPRGQLRERALVVQSSRDSIQFGLMSGAALSKDASEQGRASGWWSCLPAEVREGRQRVSQVLQVTSLCRLAL